MSPVNRVGFPLYSTVFCVLAMTAVSPLGRSLASWSKSMICGRWSAASSALTAWMFVWRRVSPARSTCRNVL